MSNFDIITLLNFTPPRFLCEKCQAILFKAPYDLKEETAKCSVCGVKYTTTENYTFHQVGNYLSKKGLSVKIENPIEHGKKLAGIAYRLGKAESSYPPMKALFEAIDSAQHFIHFTTYGLSYSIYGALKLKAQSISIKGIASNIQPDFAKEIREHNKEAEKLEIQIFEQGLPSKDWESIPHQKLIVIDGLLAFKGAANMTESGWRKSANGRDLIETVTNVQKIAKLHNNLFSPIWAQLSKTDNEISMYEKIPLASNLMKPPSKVEVTPTIIEIQSSENLNDGYKNWNAFLQKYPNAYEPWSEADDKLLKEKYMIGVKVNELALLLKRNPGKIRLRLKEKKLIKKK